MQWMEFLERKFKPGMTWENYGSVWEVDHILPLSKAKRLSHKDLILALHFLNTQPLFCIENRKKSNKIL